MRDRLFIGGEWIDAVDGGTIDVLNPHDGTVVARVAEARGADVDRAVEAANAAFPAWRDLPAAERGRLLLRLADAIEANAAEWTAVPSINMTVFRGQK